MNGFDLEKETEFWCGFIRNNIDWKLDTSSTLAEVIVKAIQSRYFSKQKVEKSLSEKIQEAFDNDNGSRFHSEIAAKVAEEHFKKKCDEK